MSNLKVKSKGLTILEVLICIGILVLVTTAISVIFNRSVFIYGVSVKKNQATNQAAIAMGWLVRDIEAASTLVVAQQDNIAMISPDTSYINYYLDSQTIQRKECVDQNYLVAEDVTRLSLKYYDGNNQILGDPVADVLSLKTIEIDITIQQGEQEFWLNTVARFGHKPDYPWTNAYDVSAGIDEFYGIEQTSDGGYILVGSAGLFLSDEIWVVKLDAAGILEWTKKYQINGTGTSYAYRVHQTFDSGGNPTGYIIGGTGGTDILVVKLLSDGTLDTAFSGTGARLYGGGPGSNFMDKRSAGGGDVLQTSDGGYIIIGSTTSFGIGQEDILLIKISANADITWAKTYGLSSRDYGSAIQQTSDNGYIIGGQISGHPTDGFGLFDGFAIKTSNTGAIEWESMFGGTSNDSVNSVSIVSAGGYILGARKADATPGQSWIIKMSDAGAIEWQKTYGTTTGVPVMTAPTTDGGYVSFSQYWYSGTYLTVVTKMDSGGVDEWSKLYQPLGNPYFGMEDFQLTSEGDYVFAGTGDPLGAGNQKAIVITIDSSGGMGCCYMESDHTFTVADSSVTPVDPNFQEQTHLTEFTLTTTNPSVTPADPTITTLTVCPSFSGL